MSGKTEGLSPGLLNTGCEFLRGELNDEYCAPEGTVVGMISKVIVGFSAVDVRVGGVCVAMDPGPPPGEGLRFPRP